MSISISFLFPYFIVLLYPRLNKRDLIFFGFLDGVYMGFLLMIRQDLFIPVVVGMGFEKNFIWVFAFLMVPCSIINFLFSIKWRERARLAKRIYGVTKRC